MLVMMPLYLLYNVFSVVFRLCCQLHRRLRRRFNPLWFVVSFGPLWFVVSVWSIVVCGQCWVRFDQFHVCCASLRVRCGN